MPEVKYYTVSQADAFSDDFNNKPGNFLSVENETHPLFKFKPDFFDNLWSIPPTDLGLAVPYISLKIIDEQGAVLKDLNIDFFFKNFDEASLGQNIRHSDRPVMSLKDIQIKTTNASGYLYYTNVDLSLVIHAPNFLADSVVASFIVPNAPLELEYGWSTPANQNHGLQDVRETLRFQVITYDLNIDETNQISLKIRGMAFNNLFNNLYVGEDATITDSETALASEIGSLNNSFTQKNSSVDYVRENATLGDQQRHDYSIKKAAAVAYKNNEKKVLESISAKFKQNKNTLMRSRKTVKTVDQKLAFTLHDVIYTMCNQTFKDFVTQMLPDVTEFRVIYGNTNDKAGNLSDVSLAKFPIKPEDFSKMVGSLVQKGQRVPTVKVFLESLFKEFVENEEVWKENLQEGVVFNKPEIVLNFTNRIIKEGTAKNKIVELNIFDVRANLPITLEKEPAGTESLAQVRNDVIDGSGLLTLEVGHANSFIKNLSLTQIADQQMKAAFIAKMHEDRTSTDRSTVARRKALKASPVTPLHLPLQGTMKVLGHTEWKPFRAFYLSSGLFLVDGVYKIMEVTHRLSAEGFTTDLVLFYN